MLALFGQCSFAQFSEALLLGLLTLHLDTFFRCVVWVVMLNFSASRAVTGFVLCRWC